MPGALGTTGYLRGRLVLPVCINGFRERQNGNQDVGPLLLQTLSSFQLITLIDPKQKVAGQQPGFLGKPGCLTC
jgi:hypothetical protein